MIRSLFTAILVTLCAACVGPMRQPSLPETALRMRTLEPGMDEHKILVALQMEAKVESRGLCTSVDGWYAVFQLADNSILTITTLHDAVVFVSYTDARNRLSYYKDMSTEETRKRGEAFPLPGQISVDN